MQQRIAISKTFTFEASHVLPRHPGKCSRLHGHSWQLKVEVDGPVNEETGFVMDYGELKRVVCRDVIDRVDHQHLGKGSVLLGGEEDYQRQVFQSSFYPSSENLLLKFVEILEPSLMNEGIQLLSLELNETCTSAARWQRKDL